MLCQQPDLPILHPDARMKVLTWKAVSECLEGGTAQINEVYHYQMVLGGDLYLNL